MKKPNYDACRRILLTIAALFILSIFTGCGQPIDDNQQTGDAQTELDVSGSLAIQYELSEEEATEFVNALYKSCHRMPEILATAMSGYPKAVASHDLPELASCDARSIDDAISLGDNGGEIQELLLEDLRAILERAEIKFYLYSGPILRYDLRTVNPEAEPGPANLETPEDAPTFEDEVLGWKILEVTITYKDGTQETSYFEAEVNYRRTEIDFSNVKVVQAGPDSDRESALHIVD